MTRRRLAGERRLADPVALRNIRLRHRRRRHRHRPARSRQSVFAAARAPQPARARQAAVPHAHPRDGHEGRRAVVSFGVMGGDMQAQGHAQVMANLIDFGMNIQDAGEAPRFRDQRQPASRWNPRSPMTPAPVSRSSATTSIRAAGLGRLPGHHDRPEDARPDGRIGSAQGRHGGGLVIECRMPSAECRSTEWRLSSADRRSGEVPSADRRSGDCRVPIDGVAVVECRSAEWRLSSADRRSGDCRMMSGNLTIGRSIDTRHSTVVRRSTIRDHQSTIASPSIGRRHSAIGNLW